MKIELPKTHTAHLFVAVGIGKYNSGTIQVSQYNPEEYCTEGGEFAVICETKLEIELPPNFEATEKMVAILEARKAEATKEYTLKIHKIDEQLAEVRALPAPEQKS